MKIEKREITTTVDVYVADDGKTFHDWDECREYEIKQQEKTLMFFDVNMERCAESDECNYIKLDTDEQVQMLKDIYNYYGISTKGLDKPGIYMYNDDHYSDTWVNISNVVDILNAKAKEEQS